MGLITPSSGRKPPSASTSNTGRNAKDSRWAGWATTGFNKSIKISDWAGNHANTLGSKLVGGERFWPTSGDYVQELDKAVRILQGFTQHGFVQQEEQPAAPDDQSATDVEQTVVLGPDGKPVSREEAEQLPPTETRTQKLKKKVKNVKIVRKVCIAHAPVPRLPLLTRLASPRFASPRLDPLDPACSPAESLRHCHLLGHAHWHRAFWRLRRLRCGAPASAGRDLECALIHYAAEPVSRSYAWL